MGGEPSPTQTESETMRPELANSADYTAKALTAVNNAEYNGQRLRPEELAVIWAEANTYASLAILSTLQEQQSSNQTPGSSEV